MEVAVDAAVSEPATPGAEGTPAPAPAADSVAAAAAETRAATLAAELAAICEKCANTPSPAPNISNPPPPLRVTCQAMLLYCASAAAPRIRQGQLRLT